MDKQSMLHADHFRGSATAAVLFFAAAAHSASCPDPLETMGGDTWRQMQQISWESAGQNYEPAQTFRPGASGRHVSDDQLSGRWEARHVRGELNWQVTTHYPFDGVWRYREVIGPINRIEGHDGFRPAVPEMQPNRRHTRLINMLQRFPALLLLQGEYDRGESLCQLAIKHPTGEWRLWLHPSTGLPNRMMLAEQDPLLGEVQNLISYADWYQADGYTYAQRIEQKVNNALIRRERIRSAQLSSAETAPVDPLMHQRLQGSDVADWARRRSHWFQRRIAAGAPMDEDPAGTVEFEEVAPNIFQITGGTHHNLVINGRTSLIVIDAPWDTRRSEAVIQALQQRWPNKLISHLIVTHHHNDHSAGLLTYLDNGAELVMAVPARQYFGTAFARSGRRNIRNKIVSDLYRLNAFGTLVELHHVPNSHAEGMLVAYLPDAKLLYTSDLFSPGRKTQHPLWARELLNTIDWLKLDVEHIVGGHGKGAANLASLEQIVAETYPSSTTALDETPDEPNPREVN